MIISWCDFYKVTLSHRGCLRYN